jgi:hypothetical protein
MILCGDRKKFVLAAPTERCKARRLLSEIGHPANVCLPIRDFDHRHAKFSII